MASWEFYQTFRDKLMPILVKLFQNIAGEGPLPNSFYKANITLTPTRERQQKRSKLQAESLMNIAATILNTVLADRNQWHFKKHIHHDQVGFIVEILGFFTTRKSINVIPFIKRLKAESHTITSIDSEKAFDKIQHLFMI